MSKSVDNAMKAYRLGAAARVLMLEKPEGWQRKIKANIRQARKLGVKIEASAFNDVVLEKVKQ